MAPKYTKPIAISIGVAIAIASVVVTGPPENRIGRLTTSGLLTGDGTSGSAVNVVVTTDSTISGTGSAGTPLSAAAALSIDPAFYGTGVDGDVTISTTVTLTTDMYYNNLTITGAGVVNSDQFRIFVRGTLTLDGVIRSNGTNGNTGAGATNTISTCGCGATSAGMLTNVLPGSTQGGSCGNNNQGGGASPEHPMFNDLNVLQGVSCSSCNGIAGRKAYTLGRGGGGGSGGSCVATTVSAAGTSAGSMTLDSGFEGRWHDLGVFSTGEGMSRLSGGSAWGTGGGAGGCAGDPSISTPAGGGTGGSGAGTIFIAARKIIDAGAGKVEAIGGNGGTGGAGTATRPAGGGGGGGGGGLIGIAIGGGDFPTTVVTGGLAGNGGNSSCSAGTLGDGAVGAVGTDGLVIKWRLGG